MGNNYENKNAFRIAAYFAAIGLVWIYGSDYLVELILDNADNYRLFQSIKGSFFVISVSCIIYFLVRQLLLKIKAKHKDVISSEQRLRKTLDNLIEGCQIIDFNWRYIYLNSVAAEHGRKAEDELIGKTITDAYPGIEKTEMYKHLRNCMEKRIPYKMQNMFEYSDGSHAWFELSMEPIPEGVFILSYNITKRKEAQLALQKSTERLIEAQRIAKLGDFEWNYKTGNVTWSEALYELLGYDKSECINYDLVNEEIHHPEDLERVTNWLNKTVISKSKILEPLEYRIFKKDKSIIDVRTSGIVDYSSPESPVVFATIQDITELKKYQEKIISAMEKAQESDRLKSAFLANMSHEIRTPLNGIMGFSEIMHKEDNLPSEVIKKYTGIIISCSDGLLQIVNDILDISSLESGNFHLTNKKFKLGSLLDDLFLLFNNKIKNSANQCNLILTNNVENIFLNADEDRLRQIFINLLDNAIKFTEMGEIEYGIHKIEDNSITFFVKDSGIGIPRKYHKLIFDRFRQAEKTESKVYGGNGLGLSIVRELLKLMKGKIWLESEVNKGAIFYFEIPFDDKILKKGKEDLSKDSSIEINRKLKILIVEDYQINTLLLKEILKEVVSEIVDTTLGCEAIKIAKEKTFDLILMDIRLPDISGLEAVKEIRKFNKSVFIIAQTAYAMVEDEHKAISAGCNAYISKPIKKEVLFEIFSEALQ